MDKDSSLSTSIHVSSSGTPQTVSTDILQQEIRVATEMAKKGEPTNPLMLKLKKLVFAGILDNSLHNSVGWFLYFRIKNSAPNNFVIQKTDLSIYLKLNTTKPSLLHSLILHEAIKLKSKKPEDFKFINFLAFWRIENLREEDWKPFRVDENAPFSSLVEKLIGEYVKELSKLKIEASPEITALADAAIERFPANLNLPFYKAIFCASNGEKGEALSLIKSLLQKQPAKSHLWRKAYELVGPIDLKIACLCKTITLQYDETFLGNARIKLARLLLRKNLPHFALFELQKYNWMYMSKRWKQSKEYEEVRSRINSDVKAADSKEIYTRFLPLADEFLLE